MIPGLMYDNTKVTVELRELVEAGIQIWDFAYPSYYDGEEKKAFEQKVLDHYWFRQIGQETPARWLHYFRSRMREIMPYYIQLYESQALMQGIEDPFGNVDIVETFEEETTGSRSGSLNRTTNDSTSIETEDSRNSNTTGSSETESSSTENGEGTRNGNKTSTHSDTPQGEVTNLDNYMSDATREVESITDTQSKTNTGSSSTENTGSQTDTGSSSSESTSNGTQIDTETGTQEGTTRHTLTRKGNQGVNTYAHDMKELRETFLNIDMMIIRELNDLFLMVY